MELVLKGHVNKGEESNSVLSGLLVFILFRACFPPFFVGFSPTDHLFCGFQSYWPLVGDTHLFRSIRTSMSPLLHQCDPFLLHGLCGFTSRHRGVWGGVIWWHIREESYVVSRILIPWTFYYSSDPLSTDLDGHCITREIWIHTVHHPSSPFIVQTEVRPARRRHHTILKSLNLTNFSNRCS
jgi:hypothetical protein